MENKTILLVNLYYDVKTGDIGHILYLVPNDKIEEARAAVEKGREMCQSKEWDTIDECIEEAFKNAGIQYKILDYEVAEIDMSEY